MLLLFPSFARALPKAITAAYNEKEKLKRRGIEKFQLYNNLGRTVISLATLTIQACVDKHFYPELATHACLLHIGRYTRMLKLQHSSSFKTGLTVDGGDHYDSSIFLSHHVLPGGLERECFK
jgi:hypothetical protein